MEDTTSPAGLSNIDSRRISGVGLFRLAYEQGREQMLARLHEAGHPDVTAAMIGLFRFASMDGRRPGEIAATARLSKQATNNLLGELERLGYLERRSGTADGRGRIVHLSRQGKALDRAVVESGRQVEREYARRLGPEQWQLVKAALGDLVEPGDDHSVQRRK